MYKGLVRKPEGKNHTKHSVVDGRIILKSISKYGEKAWTGFIWLRIQACGRLL
jgi:hypothetical protein